MTPLYLISLPLVFLTLAPGIELNLFYSLVPITGVALLLRALILGSYDVAFRFFLPVLVPTLVYAAVAATVISGVDYFFGFRRMLASDRQAAHFRSEGRSP